MCSWFTITDIKYILARALYGTWGECICIQHAPLSKNIQIFHFDFGPGDIGDTKLYIPILLEL